MDELDQIIAPRSRAWRRFNRYLHEGRGRAYPPKPYKDEKKWKMMYTRSCKMKRAAQLGFAYPVISSAVGLRNACNEWENDTEPSVYM